jgi:hypothetical protein
MHAGCTAAHRRLLQHSSTRKKKGALQSSSRCSSSRQSCPARRQSHHSRCCSRARQQRVQNLDANHTLGGRHLPSPEPNPSTFELRIPIHKQPCGAQAKPDTGTTLRALRCAVCAPNAAVPLVQQATAPCAHACGKRITYVLCAYIYMRVYVNVSVCIVRIGVVCVCVCVLCRQPAAHTQASCPAAALPSSSQQCLPACLPAAGGLSLTRLSGTPHPAAP